MIQINIELIKELRKKKKLSQKDVGKLLGISDRAVSRWELGETNPTATNLAMLSQIFGVPINDFFSDHATKPNNPDVLGMCSITDLYKVGRGPSSSHTVGPERACMIFKDKNPNATKYKAVLFGSLAKTGKGHGTDSVIKKTFAPTPCDIEFNPIEGNIPHPNTLDLYALGDNGAVLDKAQVLSVGGGSIVFNNEKVEKQIVYKETKFSEISKYCKENDLRL